MSDRTTWRLEAENERLRDEIARLRITDEEREAIAMSATVADVACEEATRCGVDDDSWRLAADMNAARAATLRGLLERLK
jgi:hypothetical protein